MRAAERVPGRDVARARPYRGYTWWSGANLGKMTFVAHRRGAVVSGAVGAYKCNYLGRFRSTEITEGDHREVASASSGRRRSSWRTVAKLRSTMFAFAQTRATAWRATPIRCATRDEFVMNGDAVALVGYGVVQTAVENSFAPMAQTNPELFQLLVGDHVELAALQGVVLAGLWILTGRALGHIKALDGLDPFDIKKTRGVDYLTAAVNVVAPWVASVLPMLVALASLSASFGLGPGTSQAEADFLVGAYVVVAAFRVVVNQALPRI